MSHAAATSPIAEPSSANLDCALVQLGRLGILGTLADDVREALEALPCEAIRAVVDAAGNRELQVVGVRVRDLGHSWWQLVLEVESPPHGTGEWTDHVACLGNVIEDAIDAAPDVADAIAGHVTFGL